MKTQILLLLVLGILMAQITYADTTMLSFSSIKATIDGKKTSGTSFDVKPNSTLQFDIGVQNDYATSISSDQSKIQNIDLTAIISGIDDGNDLEQDVDQFDLNAGTSKKKTVIFQIPLQVDDKDYDLTIMAQGEDGNGTMQTVTETDTITVTKESHQVIITKALVSKKVINCSGSVTINAEVMNLGTQLEESASLRFSNDALQLDHQEVFDLSEDPFATDNTYAMNNLLTIRNISTGTYPIQITATYDNGLKTESTSIDVQVLACPLANPESTPEPTNPKQTQVSQKPENTVVPKQPVIIPSQVVPKQQEQSLLVTYSWLFVGCLYVLVLGILIIFAMKIFKK